MTLVIACCPHCQKTTACEDNPVACIHCGNWVKRRGDKLVAFPAPPPMRDYRGRPFPPTTEWHGRPPGWQPSDLILPEPTTPAAWIALAVVAAIVGFIIGRLSC